MDRKYGWDLSCSFHSETWDILRNASYKFDELTEGKIEHFIANEKYSFQKTL